MKDTSDRASEPLPARPSPPPPVAAPVETYDDLPPDASAPPPAKKVSLRLLSRALKRHWWQALLAWVVASAALVTLAYARIKPTYDAVSTVRVEVGDLAIFAQNTS